MKIYKQRRERLLKTIGDGIAIIPGNHLVTKNSDTHFRFRQSSNFYYLTGFNEPDAILVLAPKSEFKEILFLNPKDPLKEVWDGKRLGVEAAPNTLLLDKAFSVEQFDQEIPNFMRDCKKVYTEMGLFSSFLNRTVAISESARFKKVKMPTEFLNVGNIIHPLRLVKDDFDLTSIKKSIEITTLAHKAAMSFAKPGKTEYQVQALMEFIYRYHGASGVAYESIVAGGDNANILHYIENDKMLIDGDMLLIDAGCEYNYFATDITRTFPINGKFTNAQKLVYELVLKAQLESIKVATVGATFVQTHNKAIDILVDGLFDLNVYKKGKDSKNQIIEQNLFKKYYPHGTGHWLGLDVHDAGSYTEEDGKTPVKFQKGHYFTVEPGIYLPLNDENVPKEFRGIGVRIEDDILITENGNDVITREIPKSVSSIEEFCAKDFKSYLF
ncbi:MAG: aminopeptidase P N-terminal domain-containing protein [Bacteriovoracaceae bacterium]